MSLATPSRPSLAARLWHAIDGYFFPRTTAVRLAVLRIFLVSMQLFVFMEPLRDHLKLLAAPEFIKPQTPTIIMVKLLGAEVIRTPEFLAAMYYGTIGLGVLAIVGLFSSFATFGFGVGNILLICHIYSYGESHHPEAILLMTITFLGLGPCGKALSLDAWLKRRRGDHAHDPWGLRATTPYAMWPILLSQWILCIAYFEAFAAKATSGGLDWLNGYTLQNYLLGDAVRNGRPLGLLLCQYHWLCVLMAVGAWVIEGGFFIVMFSRWAWVRRIMPWVFIQAALLHIVIYLTQAAPFFQFIMLYAMWIPFERAFARRPMSSAAAAQLVAPAPGPVLA